MLTFTMITRMLVNHHVTVVVVVVIIIILLLIIIIIIIILTAELYVFMAFHNNANVAYNFQVTSPRAFIP